MKLFQSTALKIINDNFATIGQQRHKISQSIINDFLNSDNPLDKLACGFAYIIEGAKYRKQAIECFEFYFNNLVPIPKEFRCISDWSLHSSLSKLYEKEYMFDQAIEQLKLCQKCNYGNLCNIDYINSADYTRIADIIVKRDGVDEAIKYISDLKKEKIYLKIKYAVDYEYQKLIEKKKKGYVYRPRKKRNV